MHSPWTFAPDGGRFVLIQRGTAAAWDPTTGTQTGSWQWPGKGRQHLLFSTDGRLSLTAQVLSSGERRARLWDWRTGRPASSYLPAGAGDHPAQFFADGRRLLVRTARPDGGTEVRLWDPLPPSPIQPLHPEIPPAESWWTSPDGGRIAAFSRDPATGLRRVRVHDAASGRTVGEPWDLGKGPSDNTALAFSAGGNFVAVVVRARDPLKDGWQLLAWDVAGGHEIGPPCRLEHRADVRLTADGQRAVTRPRYGPGPTQVWDVAAGRPIRTLFDGKEKRPTSSP